MAKADSKTEYDLAQDLIGQMQRASTSQELWAIAGAAAFVEASQKLSDDELATVRSTFQALDTVLKGRVKVEEIAGIPLEVSDWDFKPAGQWPKPFVILIGKRLDNDTAFTLVASSYKIYQHFERLGMRSPENSPQHITFVQESPEQMHARKAKPGTNPMWLVKGAPTVTRARRGGNAPF